VLTDQQLIDEIQRGNPRKYAVLVERHKEKAFTLAVRIVHRREEAEEIVQDAFLRAFRSLSGFRGDARFSTWLYRIVYNVSITRVSRKSSPVQSDEEEKLTLIEDDNPSAIEQLESEEQRKAVVREIERLPQNHRTALTLFYFDEMSYQEMSEIMQVPLGTVKTYLFRARDQLRERLSERLKREEQING
jgi:RNA polymerase sigma factor (sigma-70 family)